MAIINLNIKIMKNKISNISKKSKMIAVTAFVLGLAIMGQATYVSANTNPTMNQNNPMSSLVSAIATNFNLNTSDVQTIVDEVMQSERSAREAQGKVDQAEKLAQAVIDGKITQTQADLITSKLSEMKTSIDSDKDLTQEERQLQQESLKEWATSNNIPMNFLQCGGNDHEGQRGPGENNKAPNKTK